ncbi:MAG TPA: aminotransferase class V-fold PLP-dependent enzyme [Longimicrobiales bacterium]|nr:aminotransferase class V-fold PLP-dependent enzyme [Longimicrobiales bacterium]
MSRVVRAAPADAAAETLARVRDDMSADSAAAFVRIATDYLAAAAGGAGDVSPATVAESFEFDPDAGPQSLERVLEELERFVVDGANRLWHPMYMGHQVAAPLPAAIWTEPVIAALNQSIAVREMSPSATPIERALIGWMCRLVWDDDAGAAWGTFTSGGTEAIFTSLLAARNAALPEAAEQGLRGPAAIVCGEHAHYAVRRAAGQLGLGSHGAVLVPSARSRMDLDALRGTLDDLSARGVPVVAVVATAGSTATGAFDELERIGAMCEQRDVWLHVDAAHGGSALLSARHRHRLAGIRYAHSVSWDPHKMMLMPLPAGVVLVRDARRLAGAFTQDAPYLFGEGAGAGVGAGAAAAAGVGAGAEQGMRSFMCSRRADAVKVWVALRRYGVDGMAALYDGLCDRTSELHGLLAERRDFEVLHEPECNILCFRYVGAPRLPDAELDALNLSLREKYNASGEGWITTTVLDGRRVLRTVIMNPLTTREHLERLIGALAAGPS